MPWLDQVIVEDDNLGIANGMNDIVTIIEAGKMSEMDLQAIIQNEISEWESSEERNLMLVGERYYRNKPDILKRVRKAVGESGAMEPVTNLANNKLATPFTRTLVNQKINYLLSKPMSYQTQNKRYEESLKRYFDKSFLRLLQSLGVEAVNKGKAWLHPYYNEQGVLSFMMIPAQQCIPIWKDAAHTQLSAMIRFYIIETYEGSQRKDVTRIEWWDTAGVKRYVQDGGRLVPDVEFGEVSPHVIMVDQEGKQVGFNWERVPFICFKYNKDELPLIEFIKSLVDDYDLRKSDNSNNLEDLPNSTYVVKNYGGTDGGTFRKNLSIYRVVFVGENGGVETVNLDLDTEAFKVHQEQNRKDIFAAGGGVDIQSEGFLSSKSGESIRNNYAGLDLDCNMLENEFQASLEQLLWFINVDLKNKDESDFFAEEVDFIFNRDSMINESQVIQDIRNSIGILPDEFLIAQHPWVKNVKEVMDMIKAEKAERDKEPPYNFLNQDQQTEDDQ